MNFKNWYALNEVAQIGYQDIEQNKMFGPVWHGTTEDSRNKIMQTGFNINIGASRTGDTKHGYELLDYNNGIPAPVHHLGYGVYFTTVKNIAKDFQGSGKNLKQFYLDVPRLETINFGATNTMMKWWRSNGYDMPTIISLKDKSQAEKEQIRVQATLNMTNVLKEKYDAVYFKGKGLKRLLDGDQVCVYDTSKIYLFNPKLNLENEFMAGDRAKVKGLPIAVNIMGRRSANDRFRSSFDVLFNHKSRNIYQVKISRTNSEKIKSKYRDDIFNILLTNPAFKEFVDMRVKNTGNLPEVTIGHYVDDVFFDNLSSNFPESLFEKKLAKGQRVNS